MPLDRVPRAGPDQDVVDLGERSVGGLTARLARWGVEGGEVLLSGEAPFVDVVAQAGFGSDGRFDGTVAMQAAVRVIGLDLAEVRWEVEGWDPGSSLSLPAVRMRGTTLEVDLSGIGANVDVESVAGLALERTDTGMTLALPDGAVSEGVAVDGAGVGGAFAGGAEGSPLGSEVAALFREIRGWDVSGLRHHPDAPLQEAPAFVSDEVLFFAPGRYGVDSPETLALLDAAIRAALAGLLGPVEPTPPAPLPQPGADTVPTADTALVPATVHPQPPLPEPETRAGSADDGAGGGLAGPNAVDVTGGTDVAPVAEPVPEGFEAEAPTEPDVELHIPPAPTAPGPAARARMEAVGGGAGRAAAAAQDLPSADANVADARGAVEEPAAETAARAREGLAAALGERPAPSPEIVALCERIRTAIREKRPVDEDDALRSDPTREAAAAGETVAGSVEGQVAEVESGYDVLDDPPDGAAALSPVPVAAPSAPSPDMGVQAPGAAPDPIPAEGLSLDADVDATNERIADAGIDTRVTQEIPDGPFAEVRETRGELVEIAERSPAEVAAEQAAAITAAQSDMAALQQQATRALLAAQTSTVGDVAGGQESTVTAEEQTRESVGQRAQQIFDTAQTQVTTLLDPLTRTAMARWDAGLARVSQRFNDALDRVKAWIAERHSGVGGWVVGIGDAVFGLPRWVMREYDRAEREFGDGICDLLLDISADVNGVVAAAQAIIQQARDDIDDLFTAMEDEFPEWAAQERARFAGMLDGLSERATQTQTGFVQDVSQRATEAVTEAQAAVEELREAARGLVGRIVAAIEEFVDDPVTAIINGLLRLVGIPPSSFWALVAKVQQVASDIADDPERFINNLVAGIKQGFEQFFDRFDTHVLQGFWVWLFSGLNSPIPMPTEFSARALFTFALQLMGITWARVREILVRHIGEENVALVEAAWELVSVLLDRGVDGLVEMVQERLAPETIVQTVLEAAVEYLVETLINQVIVRVVGMLNPVGAIAQAIDLIYQVASWVFRNAARLFRFVETIVNGMADVIAGNIGGLAKAVETSLASLIPVVIDFLAGLLHLGGLPNEVAEVIVRLQALVYRALDAVIGAIVARGRALLAALGLGGDEEQAGQTGGDDHELGTTVRFRAAGEAHRLWFDVAGEDATLMVASTPQPLETKIAEWRGLVRSGEPADDELRAEASTTLENLARIADDADTEGDRLAVLFLQAAADPAVDPPSDDALENRQRAIAGILNRLFEIFGQEPDPEVIFARELQGVHGSARADVLSALRQLPAPFPQPWAAAVPDAKKAPAGQPLERTPLNREPHDFGRDFGHDWAASATLRAIRETAASLNPDAEEDRRRASYKALLRIDSEGGRSPAGADHYLNRYKAQLHQHAAPFDTGPTSLDKIRATIWQRTHQASAASRIREQMVARLAMPSGGPPGPDLPEAVRRRIWQLLASEATLSPPSGTTEVHIEIEPTTVEVIQKFLNDEATKSDTPEPLRPVLRWWSEHLFQAEFHHAWPQWLGGAFDQTRIYIPRVLHNFKGISTGADGFPGGFHQVFNDLFRARFATEIELELLAVNKRELWDRYVAKIDPSARGHVADLLVQAYRTVFANFGSVGQQVVQRWVEECRNTYPQTPGP